MAGGSAGKSRVVVTGDVTVDWNLARWSRFAEGKEWPYDDTVRACPQLGGVVMLAKLLEGVCENLPPALGTIKPVQVKVDERKAFNPRDRCFRHSYVMWDPKVKDKSKQDEDDDDVEKVWRASDFTGLNGAPIGGDPERGCVLLPSREPSHATLVVLDDASLGFRGASKFWPKAIRASGKADWVVVKMASPIAAGKLWRHLCTARQGAEHLADHTIAVVSASNARLALAHVSQELSWERTAQDLYYELRNHPQVGTLSLCRHVVVSLGTAGALLLTRETTEPRKPPAWTCELYFDAQVVEGQWGADRYDGKVVGSTNCLVAALARQILLDPTQPHLGRGLQNGVAAMRKLQEIGYGKIGKPEDAAEPTFPYEAIVRFLSHSSARHVPLSVTVVPDPAVHLHKGAPLAVHGDWSILRQTCDGQSGKTHGAHGRSLRQVAAEIVRHGEKKTLEDVPLGRFADLTTADRREIEAYRAIQNLIREYHGNPAARTPLSIAVFGPPGSGKSFGLKQVAEAVAKDGFEVRTFNLSQLSGPEELVGALHQVRDIALSAKLPLIFWDEFDTILDGDRLGWLRYFLAPMQDGEFQDHQVTHPIGRAIFVFAGGTCRSMREFDRTYDADLETRTEFKEAKGPDFASRLRGYVNIIGPDPSPDSSPDGDPMHIIRRALVLRGLLARIAPQIFAEENGKGEARIDCGVLQAFLSIRAYRHGVRSMEAILGMSRLSGARRFDRSCLPARTQLELHVNAQEFSALVQAVPLDPRVRAGARSCEEASDPEHDRLDKEIEAVVERLAELTHEVYCEQMKRDGRTIEPALDRPYKALSIDNKSQNLHQVWDIPYKLAAVNCVMVATRPGEGHGTLPDGCIEELAIMEHDRWLMQKAGQGWRYGSTRDDKEKISSAMRPWKQTSRSELEVLYGRTVAARMDTGALSEDEREKDREFMRRMPDVLAKVHYTIVQLEPTHAQLEASGLPEARGRDAAEAAEVTLP
jgi:hypothetical protein